MHVLSQTAALCLAWGLTFSMVSLSQSDPQLDRPELHLLEPFWQSNTMRGESLFFVQEKEGQRPTARLLFTPLRLLSLQSATGETKYVEGQDYTLDKASKTLILPQGSRIPFKTLAEMHPLKGAPNSRSNIHDKEHDFLWSEGHFFHDLQVEATYTHDPDKWKGYFPSFSKEVLPLTVGKLQRKEPLNIVVLGDSISAGYNASGFTGATPMMPAYPELVRRTLREHYGSTVSLTNMAVAGTGTAWGLQQDGAVIAAKPDLVILAFGMNDAGGTDATSYISNVNRQVNALKDALPSVEFILVASSLPNPEWADKRTGLIERYEAGLKGMCGPDVGLADMTAVWTQLLKDKKYADITGNGLNHPDDFGHRLHAEVILALLVEKF